MPMDGRFERTTIRVPMTSLDQAQSLLDKARDWPQFEDREPTVSEILRLAIKRGLPMLEQDHAAGKGGR